MAVLLLLVLFVVLSSAHNITFLDVPQYADPRKDVQLICYYISEKDDPPLHSVKWYRDNDEIFRFTPGQLPSTRTFNTTGVGKVTKGSCSRDSCGISVTLPRKYNIRVTYTCEVSTEGPRFAVVKQTKSLNIAVTLEEDPVITGVPGSVQVGEVIHLYCSTKPAMPPANLLWYIDGKLIKPEPWKLMEKAEKTETAADEDGLRSSWRHFNYTVATPNSIVSIKCEATQPTKPPYTRSRTANLIIAKSPNLGMFMASGSSEWATRAPLWIIGTILTFHIFSK